MCGLPKVITSARSVLALPQLSVARIKEALHSCDEGAVLTEDIRFMVAARPETVRKSAFTSLACHKVLLLRVYYDRFYFSGRCSL